MSIPGVAVDLIGEVLQKRPFPRRDRVNVGEKDMVDPVTPACFNRSGDTRMVEADTGRREAARDPVEPSADDSEPSRA